MQTEQADRWLNKNPNSFYINYQRRDPTVPLDVMNYLQNKQQQQTTIIGLRNPVSGSHGNAIAPAPKTWFPLPVPKCPN